MSKNVHMQDQVGVNKIEEIMHHYDGRLIEIWATKLMIIGMFLLIGVYW